MAFHFVRVLVGLLEASNRSQTRARLPTHRVEASLAEYFLTGNFTTATTKYYKGIFSCYSVYYLSHILFSFLSSFA